MSPVKRTQNGGEDIMSSGVAPYSKAVSKSGENEMLGLTKKASLLVLQSKDYGKRPPVSIKVENIINQSPQDPRQNHKNEWNDMFKACTTS